MDEFWWVRQMPNEIFPDPKIVCYSSRKLRERNKLTSFDECLKCQRNFPRTQKQCAIAHENCVKGPSRPVLMTTSNAHEIVPGPEKVSYRSQKLREMSKSTSVDECQKCPWNCPWTPKQCAIAHENYEKGTNRQALMKAGNAHKIFAGPQNSVR